MITTLGNNFGTEEIIIKDFQSDRLIVLNSSFVIDTTCDAYRSADVLEIYVPDLTLDRSALTCCYMHSYYSRETQWGTSEYAPGTIVKTWIKNRNTICIEKLPIYDEIGQFTITMATLYVPKGKRLPIEKSVKTKVSLTFRNISNSTSDILCIVEDGWCFFHCVFSYRGDFLDDDIIIDLEGFPTDVSADVVLTGCVNHGNYKGAGTFPGRIENGVITIPKPCSSSYGTGTEPFFCFYAVRDKE